MDKLLENAALRGGAPFGAPPRPFNAPVALFRLAPQRPFHA